MNRRKRRGDFLRPQRVILKKSAHSRIRNYSLLDQYECEKIIHTYERSNASSLQIPPLNFYNDGRFKEWVMKIYVEAFKNGQDNGYLVGQKDGYSQGYVKGLNDGSKIGFQDGHQEGFEDGSLEGYQDGHKEGFKDGLREGYPDGLRKGYLKGLDKGFGDGLLVGFHEGCKKICQKESKNESQDESQNEFQDESQSESQGRGNKEFQEEIQESLLERIGERFEESLPEMVNVESVDTTNKRSENITLKFPIGMSINTIELIQRITPTVKISHLTNIPLILIRKHFVENLTRQSAIELSKSRDDTDLNTVFEIPKSGQLVEGQIKYDQDFLEQVILISKDKLRCYQCLKKARHWTADSLGEKYAMFTNTTFHFNAECLRFDSVKFIDAE